MYGFRKVSGNTPARLQVPPAKEKLPQCAIKIFQTISHEILLEQCENTIVGHKQKRNRTELTNRMKSIQNIYKSTSRTSLYIIGTLLLSIGLSIYANIPDYNKMFGVVLYFSS